LQLRKLSPVVETSGFARDDCRAMSQLYRTEPI